MTALRPHFSILILLLITLVMWVAIAGWSAAHAQETRAGTEADPGDIPAMIEALGRANLRELQAIVADLTATGDTAVASTLTALAEGDLYVNDETGAVVIVTRNRMYEPLTGAEIAPVGETELSLIRVNNSLRRDLGAAVGQLTLMSDDRATRLEAAQSMFGTAEADNVPLLDEAIAAEDDAAVRVAMEQARAVSILDGSPTSDEMSAAIGTIAGRGDLQSLAILNSLLADASAEDRPAIEAGISSIEQSLMLWDIGQNVWYGLSLGSVLLLAAIGLAITFGVMGVINMAHGEMVMLGAYATFVVQEIIRTSAPELFDYSLAIALPVAFLTTALVGMAIERGVIRWLYGRPLETLLATWGLSLIIQQAVRTIFGPTNKDVGNPSWMAGAFDLGGLSVTYSRMWIVVFAIVVFAILLLVLNKTSMGLQMRAVTQNRRMASAIGIRTPWVDAMTFGLGSGIAGIAGVALSQIDNVSPNLGQNYIVDSFMVVVFGGVGNLWGTLVGALTIGVANKFLEPYSGAVLAKILILIFIILFIQRRPRGLFALKGRAADA